MRARCTCSPYIHNYQDNLCTPHRHKYGAHITMPSPSQQSLLLVLCCLEYNDYNKCLLFFLQHPPLGYIVGLNSAELRLFCDSKRCELPVMWRTIRLTAQLFYCCDVYFLQRLIFVL